VPETAHPSNERSVAHSRRGTAWALLLLLPVAALASVIVPAWLIHPFASQSQGELKLSYVLRAWSPVLTLLALLAALAATVFLWRAGNWWQRSAMVAFVLLAGVSTWFARQNHFEWMFAPLTDVAFAPANDASFIAGDDKVLAVELNGEAAAYPVRQLAYHHVVQDVVGGIPIAVTY